MKDGKYEIVEFDPHKKFQQHYLVEPHRSFATGNARSAAYDLGLDPDRVARYVFGGIETHDEAPGSLLSLLKEAAGHFPPEEALSLLEREDPRILHSRVIVTRLLSSPGYPLYTRDELTTLLDGAIDHLKKNRDDLIARGHPRTRFATCPWLHVRLSWLYPVKSPENARFERRDDGVVVYEYIWRETEQTDIGEDGKVMVRRVFEHPYEDIPLHYGLSYGDAARLEELRPKVFDLKVSILQVLAGALRVGESASLESKCLDLMCEALTYEEAEFLLKHDGELLNFGTRTKAEVEDEHSTGMPRSVTGGLSNLLELVGHCVIELNNGTYHETKRDLLALADNASVGNLDALLGPAGYWASIGKVWRSELDEILDRCWERHRKGWPYFSQGFESRISETFEAKLRRTVVLEHTVRAEHARAFEPLVRGLGETIRTYQEHTGTLPPWVLPRVPSAKRSKEGMVFFGTPAGATWGHVRLKFRDGHTVSVEVLDLRGVYNYTQMGMANQKNGNPTVQWKLLETFAEARGTLSWASPGAHRRNQKRRELLARDLRVFFRIEDDPFCLTEDGKGWRARFRVGLVDGP